MYEFEEKRVELSRLKLSPVKVTLHTDRIFRDLVAAAKAHPEDGHKVVSSKEMRYRTSGAWHPDRC
ncbi:MAG: hypothetical protein ACRDFB_09285 [Rhabdochlamydiaceae bacterium]